MATHARFAPLAYRERCDAARSFLCLSVKTARSEGERSAIRSLHEKLGPARTTLVAQKNLCEPMVAHGLADAGICGSPWDEWHARSSERIGRLMALLDEIAERGARIGIPVVALKNGSIARALHPCPGCVPMGDLDLLVLRADYVRMHEELLAMGFAVVSGGAKTAGIDAGLREGGTDYALSVGGETYAVDLQWRAVSGRWLRADQEPRGHDLIARSVGIPGTAARMLAPLDNLIQVALHTAKHTYCRAPGFRLHLDVDRLVHHTVIDWPAFVESVQRLGVGTAVFMSLSVARGLFGTPVPDPVLQRLDPGAARRRLLYGWLGRVSVFDPERPKFTRLGQLIFQTALCDGANGLWRTFFPSAPEMRERHGAAPGGTGLLVGYGRRLADVMLRYQR